MKRKPPIATRRARVLENVRCALRDRYPTLRLVGDALPAAIVGSFQVEHEGRTLARFLVEIDLPADFPSSRPVVREVGGEVPHDLDHHNPKGVACLFHPAAYWIDGYDRRPFNEFLDGPVRNFFLFQCCKREAIPWPHGEQAHGVVGSIEFFSELLHVDGRTALHCIASLALDPLQPHSLCPCGSKRAVRKCHPLLLKVARLVPRNLFQTIVEHLMGSTEVAS